MADICKHCGYDRDFVHERDGSQMCWCVDEADKDDSSSNSAAVAPEHAMANDARRGWDGGLCSNYTPPWFVGHWREWHRGHECSQDDGKPRSEAATTEIAQHEQYVKTGYLTDAELSSLRASTTSGNTVLVRALDELAARRKSS